MGYYTDYTLTARKIKNRNQFEELNNFLKDKEIINYALMDGSYKDNNHEAVFNCYDSVKWYNHSEDMVMIAEKFPNIYFMLEGAGEEFGDWWREYYHDMDIEQCRGDIVYEQPKKVQWTELIPF